VGVEEEAAGKAAKNRPREKGLRIVEAVARDSLLPALSPASFAAELSVEGIEPLFLRTQLILIAFNGLQHQRGISLDERHERRVGLLMTENN
jgi:hypothetical protein